MLFVAMPSHQVMRHGAEVTFMRRAFATGTYIVVGYTAAKGYLAWVNGAADHHDALLS